MKSRISFDILIIELLKEKTNEEYSRLLHITDGNNIEGKVVSVMGGEIYELHTERIIRETTEKVTA